MVFLGRKRSEEEDLKESTTVSITKKVKIKAREVGVKNFSEVLENELLRIIKESEKKTCK